MRKSIGYCLFPLLIIIILSLGVAYKYSNPIYYQDFDQYTFIKDETIVDLRLYADSSGSVLKAFPYKQYSASDNWKDIYQVVSDLKLLDSIYGYSNVNRVSLLIALTDSLYKLRFSDLDSINLLISWAEQFKYAQNITLDADFFYASVFDYWMNYIATTLKVVANKNKDVAYSFKYKYLRSRCQASNYGIGENNDYLTKIINNIIQNRWKYLLIDRLWLSTSLLFKILLILFTIITFYGYYSIIVRHLKKK